MKKSLFSSSYTNTYFVLNSKVKDFVKQLNIYLSKYKPIFTLYHVNGLIIANIA